MHKRASWIRGGPPRPGARGPITGARRPSSHPKTKCPKPAAHRLATDSARAIARSDADPAGRPAVLNRRRLSAATPPRKTDAAVARPTRTEPASAAARPADAALRRPMAASAETAADERRRRGARPGERGRCQRGLRQPAPAAPGVYRPAGRRPPRPAGCPAPRRRSPAAPEADRQLATARPWPAQAEAAAEAAAQARCHFHSPLREQHCPAGGGQAAETRVAGDVRCTVSDASAR